MLVVRGKLEQGQAIIGIGIQRFDVNFEQVSPVQPSSAMAMQSYRALLDTGAQRTCLTNRVIAVEALKRHGKKPIKNVHDTNLHGLYLVRFGFWCENVGQKTYYGLPGPVEVINIADNDRFDAILGMDVLGQFNMTFGKDGQFTIEL